MIVICLCILINAPYRWFFLQGINDEFTLDELCLKVTAFFKIGAGSLNLLVESYSWAIGSFLFELVLMISAMMAENLNGVLTNTRLAKIKKNLGTPKTQ